MAGQDDSEDIDAQCAVFVPQVGDMERRIDVAGRAIKARFGDWGRNACWG